MNGNDEKSGPCTIVDASISESLPSSVCVMPPASTSQHKAEDISEVDVENRVQQVQNSKSKISIIVRDLREEG